MREAPHRELLLGGLPHLSPRQQVQKEEETTMRKEHTSVELIDDIDELDRYHHRRVHH